MSYTQGQYPQGQQWSGQQQPQQQQGIQPYGQPQGYAQGGYNSAPAGTISHGGMSPEAHAALGHVDLLAGEQIVYAVQADGFFLGTNPALKAVAEMQARLVRLTGGHVRMFLVVTNQRVLMIQSRAAFCGCFKGHAVSAVALSSIVSAGSAKDTQYCFFHTRAIYVESLSERYNMVIKNLDDAGVKAFVSNLSSVIVANSSRRSAA